MKRHILQASVTMLLHSLLTASRDAGSGEALSLDGSGVASDAAGGHASAFSCPPAELIRRGPRWLSFSTTDNMWPSVRGFHHRQFQGTKIVNEALSVVVSRGNIYDVH